VADSVLTVDAPAARLRLVVCMAARVSREASARHALSPGSGAALGQGLAAALVLAAHERTRVDVQLECNGPLRGLLVDADERGTVRGLVRANTPVGAPRGTTELERFDARPLLASPHDERAGMISVLRAPSGPRSGHRAAFPFAGADIGAALTLVLRGDREQGGEMALEALVSAREPLATVAGVIVAPLQAAEAETARALGKPLRQGGLLAAIRGVEDARGVAERLSRAFHLGGLQMVAEVTPRLACRCSRERVAGALRSLGAPELDDMARRDGGARLTCDFCNAAYTFSADELRRIAQP
jgi:molecular chaperone Hsp33